jgi:AraC family cel operon transcriptional repressor
MPRIRLKPLLVPGDVCHVAISTITGNGFFRLHSHDFVEVFLILEGTGLHSINGKILPLTMGDLVFIRAPDCHDFASNSRDGMRLLNVAFLFPWFASFRSILPEQKTVSLWMTRKMPPTVHLSGGTRESLKRKGDDLILSKSPRHFGLAQFCLEAFGVLQSPLLSKTELSAPEWLIKCTAAMDRPENLQKKLSHFQQMAGRSPEHFARLCRFYFGVPPTELLNQARIRYAKRKLLESNAKILDIAYDCGFENVGYFHRVFLRLSGLTPRYWRFKHRSITVPF